MISFDIFQKKTSIIFLVRFGCKLRSPSTGIIFNDGMDDFSTPGVRNHFGLAPSPANFIKPKKIPLSSMAPAIVLDKNDDVHLAIGAAGGSKITSSVVYVSSSQLYHTYIGTILNAILIGHLNGTCHFQPN